MYKGLNFTTLGNLNSNLDRIATALEKIAEMPINEPTLDKDLSKIIMENNTLRSLYDEENPDEPEVKEAVADLFGDQFNMEDQ